jgi:lipopolysaccharide/colanic/teichoic acid biosynthesis glycosyltransferase
MYSVFFKRTIDLMISLFLVIIFSPILIITTILLIIINKSHPFFYQERPGRFQKRIEILKFKSMTNACDSNGNLLPDVERITKFGAFIRKTSIDELPQLYNVIRGDMSLIGPRPLLFKYIPLYNEEQNKRHLVRPGITGWAQVNGRNSISWKEKFAFDVYYVDHVSFSLDIKIFWLTIVKILKREGVNQSNARPMLPFDGTN